ncbi:MAG TPA: lasso peptide biosynthesis PqqD family chaperone [Actinomycetota bacterium]|nr:lasso peptide biosynthesis PqqD family chaperone [Actinomycetota bacterium]
MPDEASDVEVPKEVLSRELDGEAVLLDLRSGRYFGLNGTGAVVWSMLKDGAEREQIAHQITEEFAVDLVRARADVDAFIESLVGRGLITYRDRA